MRSTIALAMLVGFALATPSCLKMDFFKRRDTVLAAAKAGPRIGTPAPEIDSEDFDGNRVKLSDYRGKVVVVVFWYSTCVPCRQMIPHERELVERYRDQPFAMIGVYGATDYDRAREVMASNHVSWPVVKAGAWPNPITTAYSVDSFPGIFVIDANGVIRATDVRGQSLDNAVAKLLAEMESKR
jgi:cytochrome oxidase Cu insertion factor (SCO1/SenC/PrrC family)